MSQQGVSQSGDQAGSVNASTDEVVDTRDQEVETLQQENNVDPVVPVSGGLLEDEDLQPEQRIARGRPRAQWAQYGLLDVVAEF